MFDLDCLFLCMFNNFIGLLLEWLLLQVIVDCCKLLNINLILDEVFIDFILYEMGFIFVFKDNLYIWVLCLLIKFYVIFGLWLGYFVNSDDVVMVWMCC